jgi:hypothetical protein
MSESIIDELSESGMPWASRISWQAANEAVDYHLQRYRADLKQLAICAREIKSYRKLIENEFIRIIS